MKSETIGKLAEALSKAQGIMEGAAKDSANPFFKSKYADLASVWDACRLPLSTHGLAVVQVGDDALSDAGKVTVETILMHSSGEWISGRITLTPVKADPQGVGSAITYARRYGLQAIVGIAPEDDDGNAASGKRDGKTVTTEYVEIGPRGPDIQAKRPTPAASREPSVTSAPSPATAPITYCGKEENSSFYAEIRKALPLLMKPEAETIGRKFLESKGYKKENGEGTLKMVDKALFPELMAEAVKSAIDLF